MIEKIVALVLLVNSICSVMVIGAAWSSFRTQVVALEQRIDRLSTLQASWDVEADRPSDVQHQDRARQIEAEIFKVIYHSSEK